MQQLKVYTQESKCTNSLLNIFPQKTNHQVPNKSVYLIKIITNPLNVQKKCHLYTSCYFQYSIIIARDTDHEFKYITYTSHH